MDPTQVVLSYTGQGPYAGVPEDSQAASQEKNGEQNSHDGQ